MDKGYWVDFVLVPVMWRADLEMIYNESGKSGCRISGCWGGSLQMSSYWGEIEISRNFYENSVFDSFASLPIEGADDSSQLPTPRLHVSLGLSTW